MGFWTRVSRFILTRRYFILIVLAFVTYLLSTQMQYMRFSYTEANLLPKDHEINLEYDKFLDLFGEEGNLIILATEDTTIFTPKKFKAWNDLSKKLATFAQIDFAASVGDIKKLVKNKETESFDLIPLFDSIPKTAEEILALKTELFDNLPFYDNLLFSKKTGVLRTVVYMDKEIVNTAARKDFIFDELIPAIETFEKDYNIDVRVSGMPYIRTMNAQNIIDEIGLFVILALAVTALIFFFFFRSIRATLITLLVVSIGVIWAFGFIGLFRYEISVLMALIPPLIIVLEFPMLSF